MTMTANVNVAGDESSGKTAKGGLATVRGGELEAVGDARPERHSMARILAIAGNIAGGIIVALLLDGHLAPLIRLWLLAIAVLLVLLSIIRPIRWVRCAAAGFLAGLLLALLPWAPPPPPPLQLSVTHVGQKRVGPHLMLEVSYKERLSGEAIGLLDGKRLIIEKRERATDNQWLQCGEGRVESGKWRSSGVVDLKLPQGQSNEVEIRVRSPNHPDTASDSVALIVPRSGEP